MTWKVLLYDDFEPEFNSLSESVQNELIAQTKLLEIFGPELGRPHVDTLKNSDYNNMKELRFNADNGIWRIAFAFDPKRDAILLVAGNKAGVNEKRFYKQLIMRADKRFKTHLDRLKTLEE
ncbi:MULTISPECIES: type II toxin-antitoxin system RelE/ParE family toxin [Spirulina sp. CCY15215]|uniref:type II toxin-antitoxin system RelE/ParE family toxin n=1 Tax=Spirulina sp. CCY15215 TaxID=2767591 RepID=UPI001950435B